MPGKAFAEPAGSHPALQITATLLVHIPGKFHKGQENIVPVPAGRDRGLDDFTNERQQLALAFGGYVAVLHRRSLKVKFHDSALPSPGSKCYIVKFILSDIQ
jgi:hypothetical protein